MALEMLRSHELGLRPLEDWLAAERRRKAQEEREIAEIEADALAQVARPRERWCIGSGESLWSILSAGGLVSKWNGVTSLVA